MGRSWSRCNGVHSVQLLGAESAKARKLRGGKTGSAKKDNAGAKEAIEPGTVRIMAPRDGSSSAAANAAAENGSGKPSAPRAPPAAGATEASGDKTNQRGQKGGAGRGRGRKENSSKKPVESGDASAASVESKPPRSRRDSRTGGGNVKKDGKGDKVRSALHYEACLAVVHFG